MAQPHEKAQPITGLTRRSTLGLLGATALPMPFVRRAAAQEAVVNV